MHSKPTNITETLRELEKDTQGTEISVHDIISNLSGSGFGSLLILLSLIVLMPTGAIPGVPLIVAVLIFCISLQIFLGSESIWLPKKLRDGTISREKYIESVDKFEPYTKKIDRLFFPRLTALTKGLAKKIISVSCMILSIAIAIMGFVPFMAMVPAFGVALFGLGIASRDGVPVALATVMTIISIVISVNSF